MTNQINDFEQQEELTKPTFEDALEELKNDDESLPSPALIVGLSGLSSDQLAQLGPVWDNLRPSYRRILMQMLVDSAISNIQLDFKPIGYATLTSEQEDVRQAAIEILWEDTSLQLLDQLVKMALEDPSVAVREEATKSLARFVWSAEMGDYTDDIAQELQDILLRVVGDSNEPIDIRRYAIEALGNCTRKEVTQVIGTAYKHANPNMRISAIIAMGRSCDSRWESQILEELENTDDEIRIAATRAAGEIQMSNAVGLIIKNIEAGEREEQEVAIWALGEIGGAEATRALDSLLEGAENVEDNDLIELIEDAVSVASLGNGDLMLGDFTDLDAY